MIRTGLGVLPAKGGNVSESGMLLSTRAEEGSAQEPRLWLSFTLPRVPHVLQLRAEVVRKQRSGEQFHLGVRFVEMPRGVRRMLRTYVFTGGGRVKDYSPDEHQATV